MQHPNANPPPAPPHPRAAPGHAGQGTVADWESELFVVRGDDRRHLLERVRRLSAFVAVGSIRPKDLAFTLDASLAPGGSRLALVARSIEELRRRLDRAAKRLSDPACHQVRDATGIYFFERPLHPEGRIAFLFPGEGAQYLGMLGDLCPHFPEVRECFDYCDALGAESGGQAPVTRFMTLADDAPTATRAALQGELRSLTNAMFSVLVADWALAQVLECLGLKADAMAGHSIGEIAALGSAGAIGVREQWTSLVTTMQELDEQKEQNAAGAAVLLAIGASRRVAADVLAACPGTAGPNARAFLAMDNCPHQVVLVGLSGAMEPVEAELQKRNLLYERLRLNRPYHTPMFEPQTGPLARTFDAMEFRRPQTTVYSCTTGMPFPSDPGEIRRLALSHWHSPVEFTRMVENMHADGVRIFVEVGPRGNLCSFVDDVLRDRPCLAVPANVERRGGITQLNHMAAQLVAHHVPLRLEHLFARRDPQRLDWERHGRTDCQSVPAEVDGLATHPTVEADEAIRRGPETRAEPMLPAAPRPLPAASVLKGHWALMEQFLDVQKQVTQNYLRRDRRGARGRAAKRRPSSNLQTSEVFKTSEVLKTSEVCSAESSPVARPDEPLSPAPRPALPLLGEVVRHVPGRELLTRRLLDLREDRFAADHTIGGRQVSRVDPTQYGLPIGPMTFTLEMMAEVASLLVPGLVVIGLRGVRLLRWLAYDEQTVRAVEVAARPSAGPGRVDGTTEVTVEVRDLGPTGTAAPEPPALAAAGTVVLAPAYPEAPPADPFPLTGERAPRVTIDDVYHDLFHGPRLMGLESLLRISEEGVEGRIAALPRGGLFASIEDPQFLTDPVLLDVSTHPLVAWHLEAPDRAGRVLVPFELVRIELFGPRPAVGERFTARGRVEESSPRHFRHGVQIVRGDGRLWCRSSVKFWRWYLPFGDVNFHGRKDEYFLSNPWQAALPGPRGDDPPQVACVYLKPPGDLLQPAMQQVMARIVLSPREMQQFRQMEGPDRRRADWLFGRMAAKDAFRLLWHQVHGERLFPADIEIGDGPEGRPTAGLRDAGRREVLPSVSVSQAGGVSAALAAYRPHLGIAIAEALPASADGEGDAPDSAELRVAEPFGDDREQAILRFHCAKKAAATALGGDAPVDAARLAVCGADPKTGTVLVAIDPRRGEQHPRFPDAPTCVYTNNDRGLVVATTLGEAAP